MNDFTVLILSHGRANNFKTYDTLRKLGYTGKIVVVIDNLDPTSEAYKKKFGDELYIFDKQKYASITDSQDNTGDLRCVVFARNATFDIAEELGYKYFLVLDDDYSWFQYRFDDNFSYRPKKISNLDRVFYAFLEFYKSTSCLSIALAQGGDFIGGGEGKKPVLKRKCMNSFFCSTDRRFLFTGRTNEDCNAYVNLGSKGKLFFTYMGASLEQGETQQNEGGLTDIYLSQGTYIKTFYTVMLNPSSVVVNHMNPKKPRLHHSINWKTTVPKIIRENFKK